MTGQESYIQAVKSFNRWLEQKRLRKTQERFAVLKMAWQLAGHFGAEELRLKLEEAGYRVSRATVYNTLGLLEECGVLRRHHFGSNGGEALFERGTGSHLHLICTRCGRVSECDTPAELSSALEVCNHGGFSPSHFSAYIYGVCASCAEAASATLSE